MNAEYFERKCGNCIHSFNRIDEKPCNKCSHIYEDQWAPISTIILTNSAKMIKKMCTEFDCGACPFHNPGKDPVCLLATKDDNNIPSTWEV